MAELQARNGWFWINNKKTRLFSGAMHYFRIPREYWKDRLVKLRATGCNVLETYVPWNVHEPRQGEFDFSDMLDIRAYIKLAAECGLFVIVRPGPYICSEWDFGGLPSWLLRDQNMRVRSRYEPFMKAVENYFKNLLPRISDLQYTGEAGSGGPIIAWQIENEYGSFGKDTEYLLQIQRIMMDNGCNRLFFTSDNDQGILNGCVENVLMTANFQKVSLGLEMLNVLKERQPDMPRMVMEFWTGWFDHWGDSAHNTTSLKDFDETLTFILREYGSVNFYMFHGGTNFGFMNGANEATVNDQLPDGADYKADVTSYDYDAPLSEDGQITAKYTSIVELLKPYLHEVVYLGDCPSHAAVPPAVAYDNVTLQDAFPLSSLLVKTASVEVEGPALPMELLPVNNNCGQSYGWTLYRKLILMGGQVKVQGQIRDRTQVFLDGRPVCTFDCNTRDYSFSLESGGTLDLLVENMARTNYEMMGANIMDNQRKGINNTITLNDSPLLDWSIYPLDFSSSFMQGLNEVTPFALDNAKLPALLLGRFTIVETSPKDTFMDLSGWGKGVIFVNNRNLGRYWPTKGPTRTVFLPGCWLLSGENQILMFETEQKANPPVLRFLDKPSLG